MKRLAALKAELARQGITSLQISRELGINHSVFSLYLNGWRKMPDHVQEQVSSYLNIDPEKLFDVYSGLARKS